MAINQYSPTPASNDMANYFQTGMAPSKVKNAGWDIMADMADYIVGGYTSGGTANAQTLTQTRPLTALVAGLRLTFIPGFTNTGAMTFAPDGLTAKNVFANGVAAIAGMVVLNVPVTLVYDGTQWNLQNPQSSTGSFTISQTGTTVTQTGTATYRISADAKFVSLMLPILTGTSNATTMTWTGIPAIIQPSGTAATMNVLLFTENNGAWAVGTVNPTNASTWNVYPSIQGTTWNNTGTKATGGPESIVFPLA